MATKEDKKKNIRDMILSAAKVYSEELAGKTFLYVYGHEYFELWFAKDRFAHLTGVNSRLSANDFYKKCISRKLTCSQFYFDREHRYDNAKRKLAKLQDLPVLTSTMICVLKDIHTLTVTYKIGITNLEFTLAVTEYLNQEGKHINNWFVPRSLRVKDKSLNLSSGGEIVDFIFSKNAEETLYSKLCFCDKGKTFPDEIKSIISRDLYESYKNLLPLDMRSVK